MPILIYSPDREKPPRNSTLTLNGVYLKPGSNTISEEELELIIAYDDLGYYQKLGAIEICEAPNLNEFIPQALESKATLPKRARAKEPIITQIDE